MPYTYDHPHPAVTVDVAVLTIRGDELNALLIRRAADPFKGEWAFPGGFVDIDEGLEHAARRELREETGLEAGYLEQLHTFGDPDRDPRERVISVAYLALISSDRVEPRAASDAGSVGWFPVAGLPRLAFDHREILATAVTRLREKLHDPTIASQLIPAEFTMGELLHVCEVLTGEPIDGLSFARRMRSQGVIEPTGSERRRGAHRPAKLYRFVNGQTSTRSSESDR